MTRNIFMHGVVCVLYFSAMAEGSTGLSTVETTTTNTTANTTEMAADITTLTAAAPTVTEDSSISESSPMTEESLMSTSDTTTANNDAIVTSTPAMNVSNMTTQSMASDFTTDTADMNATTGSSTVSSVVTTTSLPSTADATSVTTVESSSPTTPPTTSSTVPTTTTYNRGGDNGSSSDDDAVVIAVSVVVALLVVAAVVLVVIFILKRRRRPQRQPSSTRHLVTSYGGDEEEMLPIEPDIETEMDISELEGRVLKELNSSPTPFKGEFDLLTKSVLERCQIAVQQENFPRNRYTDILPYDETIVTLQAAEDSEHSTYINANFIENYKASNSKAYIACQGPLIRDPDVDTVADFWQMVWQYNAPVIIMLTSLIESDSHGRDILKCARYWPASGSCRYGRFTVMLEQETVHSDYVIRKFFLSLDHSPTSRRVTQYHFRNWRDFSTAPNCGPLLKMRRLIKNEVKGQKHAGPQIVHCSAGVGRTGTYMAIDQLIDEGEKRGKIDVFHYAQRMRRCRMRMVQTWQQYAFIYSTLNEYFLTGSTQIPHDQLVKLEESNMDVTKLEQQFRVLEMLKPSWSEHDTATARATLHKDKNRFSRVVPAEKQLVAFEADETGNSPYINAVFVPDTFGNPGYYATQIPLENTVEEFWRLVVEFKCSAIVCLQDSADGAKWMPNWEEPLNISDKYHVLCTSEKLQGAIAIKDITVEIPPPMPEESADAIYENQGFEAAANIENAEKTSNDGTASESSDTSAVVSNRNSVRFYKLKGYDAKSGETGMCSESDIYDVIKVVRSELYDNNNVHGPLVVLCLNGASVSGVFIACSVLLSQLTHEQEVDVFQVVKQLQMVRPHFVPSLEQYQFLHKCAAYFARKIDASSTI